MPYIIHLLFSFTLFESLIFHSIPFPAPSERIFFRIRTRCVGCVYFLFRNHHSTAQYKPPEHCWDLSLAEYSKVEPDSLSKDSIFFWNLLKFGKDLSSSRSLWDHNMGFWFCLFPVVFLWLFSDHSPFASLCLLSQAISQQLFILFPSFLLVFCGASWLCYENFPLP